MTQFGSITLGRLSLVELPTMVASPAAAAPTSTAPTGHTLALSGQESLPDFAGSTAAQLSARQADLLGMGSASSFIPVVFSDKAELNGYYIVSDSSADLQNWEGESVTLTWKADLNRIGTDLEVDIESRMTGTTRNNMFAITGVRWHSPSIGHYAYFSAQGNTPTVVTRIGLDGAHVVYLNLPTAQSTIPRWGCAVGNYLGGRVKFLDGNSIERSGVLFSPATPANWALSNGLINITPLSSGGVLNVASYTSGSGAYQAKTWDLRFAGTTLGVPLGISLLRNEPEMVVARLLWSTASLVRVTGDLTLRRGARHVELYLQSQIAGQFKVVRGTTENGTTGGSGAYITATSNDAAGNKYILGSALTTTADTTNGGLSSSASVLAMDAFIGAVVGGTGAVTGDTATDLYNQYIATPSELVQGIRR
jgi:hypothetical protein